MIIRHFEAADYPALVLLHNALWPDNPKTVAQLQYEDAGRAVPFQRFVALQEASVIAYLSYEVPHWAYQPGKFFLRMAAQPQHWQDAGQALYQRLLEALQTHQPTTLTIAMPEDHTEGLALLQALGFAEALRENRSLIDLRDFDPAPYSGALAKAQAAGIRIATLAELSQEDADWQRKWWRIHAQIEADVPSIDPVTPPPFEQFQQWMAQPTIETAAYHIALDSRSGVWVGHTGLKRVPADPTRRLTGVTGVLRDYRRKGIATALKLHSMGLAQSQGVRWIYTKNEAHNPMYALNLHLGFRPMPSSLELECDLVWPPPLQASQALPGGQGRL